MKKITLHYFKPTTGKWYASAELELDYEYDFEVFTHVNTQRADGRLPGISSGGRSFIVLTVIEGGGMDVCGLEEMCHAPAFEAGWIGAVKKAEQPSTWKADAFDKAYEAWKKETW